MKFFSNVDPNKYKAMQKAGKISALALKMALSQAKEGVSLLELDKVAEDVILSNGALPAFKRVDNYPFTTCINVNHGIVHGIPNDYRLKAGDLLSIDLGAYIDGYNSDQCWTVEISTNKESKFLTAGEVALRNAIKVAVVGNTIGDISNEIEKTIKQGGFSVSEDLVGHGIGKKVHERPNVPCFGDAGAGPILREGMTLAIEVIYSKGNSAIVVNDDGWTIETFDKSLSAVFEHTIGITRDVPLVFTKFDEIG
ncbi:type I methionyl aminopeptidase [Patescibacteria group bacterium]|nr:type I methionyl aminopeptidase [Patescibacteria group bacterium]